MTSMGHAQILGFSEDVERALETETEALAALGVDVSRIVEQIRVVRERTATSNAHQEDLKRDLRAATIAYTENRRKLYVISSGALDVVIAAVEKTSPAAQNLRRLRSRVHTPRGPGATAAGPPTPAP